jgi:peptide/nickel transport system ATP-binding protein
VPEIAEIGAGVKREIIRLKGDLPSPANPPAGCHFHPRCPAATAECAQQYPGRTDLSATHTLHCYHPQQA